MSWDDLLDQAATTPKGDPRNYLVPVEALEGQPQRPAGVVREDNLAAYDGNDLATMAPAQRAFAMAALARGSRRPVVTQQRGPPLRGGIPNQANYFPVGIPVANGSQALTTFAPFPNPQPPSAYNPMRDVLAIQRMQASRNGTFPQIVEGGSRALTRAGQIAMKRSEASRYAPNGAYDQAVRAMEARDAGGARTEAPLPASHPGNFSGAGAIRMSGVRR